MTIACKSKSGDFNAFHTRSEIANDATLNAIESRQQSVQVVRYKFYGLNHRASLAARTFRHHV